MMDNRTAPREFAVAPPARDPRWMIALLVAIPEAIAFVAIFVAMRARMPVAPAVQPGLYVEGLIAIPVAVVFVLVTCLLWWAVQRRRVALADGMLEVTATLYRRKLPVAAFDLAKARVLAIDEHKEWRPFLKSNGIGLPGLRAGWFRSRGFRKLFCLLTARDRVLVLPERSGGATLLSMQRPQQLLDALRESADASRASR